MTLFEWMLLVVLSVLWGGAFLLIEIAVEGLPPLTIVAARVLLAAIALHAVMLATRRRIPWDVRSWAALAVMGLLNNALPFSLLIWAQTHIGGGLAAILIASTPVFTVLTAHVATDDEKLSRGRALGVTLGFLGVVLMIGADALSELGLQVLAELAVLGTALCYALAGVYGRRLRRMNIGPLAAATGQVTAAGAIMVPVALLIDRPWELLPPSAAVVGAVTALGVISTALAYILYFRILSTAGATNVLLVTFLVPVSAIILTATVLGETLEVTHVIGMGLIMLGLAAIDGRMLRWIASRDSGGSHRPQRRQR